MLIKKHSKILLSILLAFSILCSGCHFSIPISATSQEKIDSRQNEKFEAFLDQLFHDEIQQNTLNMHYSIAHPENFGITNYPVSLGTYGDPQKTTKWKELKKCLKKIKSFPYEKLTLKNKLTCDILTNSLETELGEEAFPYYDEPLSPINGVQSQLPVLLSEYTFRNVKDISDYLEILKQIGSYFDSIMEYEKDKSKEGLFMADFALNHILSQCGQFTENLEENYLIQTFDERIDAFEQLTDQQRAQFKEQNRSAVKDYVFPAYSKLIADLQALKGTGKNERGLNGLPKGKEYYEYLTKKTIGTSRTVEGIQTLLDKQMQEDLSTMSRLLKEDKTLPERMTKFEFTLSKPDEILKDLQSKITKDFPNPPKTEYQIKYVPKSLEKHLSPAFYLVSPIDDMSRQVIYINNGTNYDNLSLYTTLAHEGYPGHLYQTICSHSFNSSNVRSLLNYGGYAEGWATYVEMYSYSICGLEKNLASLLQVNSSIILNLYSHIDVGVHYEGWDYKQVLKYLSGYGLSDPKTAKKIYENIIEEPANYLKYYVGYLEFEALKKESIAKLSDDFNLKNFHAYILQTGAAPFDILRKYLAVQKPG